MKRSNQSKNHRPTSHGFTWLALLLSLILPLQPALAGKITLYFTDASGSPVAATDVDGNIIWREHYQPYGEKLNEPLGEDIGYTGHEFDAETGLTYMQARYYDPEVGRFLAIDPVGFKPNQPMTFNRYSYANNNPYKYVDPDGEATVYVWESGPTANDGNSIAGHIAVKTENGTYVSKFPSDTNQWSSKAKFHSPTQDKSVYGSGADYEIEVELTDEKAAGDYANKIVGDPNQEWSPTNNCADAVEAVLNKGGLETDHNDPINTPSNLKEEITSQGNAAEKGKPNLKDIAIPKDIK